ncbi:type VI secretion system tip protein VgrG [Rubrolithibacter danxiaensis]|uniref:type VI secretion system tip protein VgrG n=1 Tax=Rubrolithibacter danxiaensis TaxID=3390805 RepID=UPI003BF833ED
MPEERLIPAVQTVAEFSVKVNGTEIPRTVPKLSVNVMKMVNKIASATLVIMDGDIASGEFPLSNGDLFTPGNEIEIEAGDTDQKASIFKGIIIKQALKVRNNSSPELIVECRHKAVKTTIGRNNACFHEATDADVIEEILKSRGFSSDEIAIEPTPFTHKELVQYNCTDWDFIVSRAEACGKLVLCNDDKISIRQATVTGNPALSLLLGATIIELDAEMDSRTQYLSVKSQTWDMANQSVSESIATAPAGIEEHGSLAVTDLAAVAGPDEFILQHPGAIPSEESKAWADAQLLKSRLSKIRGRAKFQGISAIDSGDVIELNGLGGHFSGKAFVSGVRHDFTASQGWKTQVQFGSSPGWFTEENEVDTPKAGGLLPGIRGLQTGIVTDNEDPGGEMRVRIKLPFINPEDDGIWARIALTDAGKERGLFFRPEINDEVLVGFLHDDPRQPVILGMLNSSALPSPLSPSNANHQKGYTSREKLALLFDDERKSISLETPGGNKFTISDYAKGISLEDQNGNKIQMDDKGISIQAVQKLELKAGTQLVIGGTQLSVSADASLELKGGGSTKVKSDGALQIQGSVVQIN